MDAPGTVKKNIGTLPHNSASVVIPNARPGFDGSKEAMVQSVMDMLMLKSRIPIKHIQGNPCPKTRQGTDASKLKTPTLRAPRQSANIPPEAFPTQAPILGNTDKNIVVFQSIGIIEPA